MMLLPHEPSHGSELLNSDAELAHASEPTKRSYQRFTSGRVAAALACALLLGLGLVAACLQRRSAHAASLWLTQLDAVHSNTPRSNNPNTPRGNTPREAKDRKNLELGAANPELDARLDQFAHKKDANPDLRPKSSADLWPGWPCGPTEELYDTNCYISCDNATDGAFPFRAGTCMCCKGSKCLLSPGDGESVIDCARFDRAADGLGAHQPILPDCPYEDEEIFEGLCYTKCSVLTMGKYPIRTAMNTCSNNNYGGEWTLGFGPCSGFGIGGTKCAPHMPKAFGAGFDQPDRRPGIGPFGWTTLKLPEVPEEFAKPPVLSP
eukprot:TRINITY_DN7888_c0_g1_i1.p1 TRINITY_DN7888_c0_g1~~TRINITY_DN7888_c0_g1_i1.p1  ORF type:complete len:321 (-),score=31.50 TRINITY_DN7888_c0_g1_i1:259-1221(-)